MTYPNGKTVKYTYDDMNRLVSVKGVDGATTKYEYDALGRRIATDGAKEDTVYTYDEVGNLVSQTTTGAYDLALEYAYDLSGRMTQESRTENGATLTSSYIYDALGQLTSFTRSDGQSESYTYDPVGNMTAKTQNGVSTAMRYNAANQLIQSVSGTDKTTYTYDANGNLVRSENAGGARSYAYNALNLLQSFTREDGYTETYTYNANRLLSTIKTSEDLTTTLTWDILYGDGVVISENQNGQTTSYTYGLERISAKTGSTRTEYVYDGRGSVAAEVSYNDAWYTFGGGLARKNVVSKSYSPFGELLTKQTSGFGYNGEYYNAATGMIYLRARFYEPEMNRFGQKDLLRGSAFAPQSLNRYLYVQNDPMNLIDTSGMSIRDWGKNLVNKATNAWNTFTTGVKELIDVGQTIYYTLTDKPDPRRAANQPVDAISGAAPHATQNQIPIPFSSPIPWPDPTPTPIPNSNQQYTNSSQYSSRSDTRIQTPSVSGISERVACTINNAATVITHASGSILAYLGSVYSKVPKHLFNPNNVDFAKLGKLYSAGSAGMTVVGGVIDLSMQLLSGESAAKAVTKTLAHIGIGILVGATVATGGLGAILGGALLTVVLNYATDAVIDAAANMIAELVKPAARGTP